MKKLLLIAVGFIATSTIFVGCCATNQPEVEQPKPKQGQHHQRGDRQRAERPQQQDNQRAEQPRNNRDNRNINPELSKEMRTLSNAYRENQSAENKDKLVACLGKIYDQRVATQTKRIEELKSTIATSKARDKVKLEKELAELEKHLANNNKQDSIEKSLERILNEKTKQPHGGQGGRLER